MHCRVPLRVDLAGGWSDIPPFARAEGGAVLNVAITQYVTGEVDTERGFRLTYGLEMPSGGGLGSSAALSVGWLALVRSQLGQSVDPGELAASACDLARLLGVRGGVQDEYAAAFGGINLIRVGEEVDIESIAVSADAVARLEAALVLCDSGVPRHSTPIHEVVWNAYEQGDRRVAGLIREMRDCALEMRDALVAADLDTVAALVNRNWTAQRALHPAISTPRMDMLISAALGAGAHAVKACGAGGGGWLVFMVDDGTREAVEASLRSAGGRLIDVGIDVDGALILG